MGAPSEAWTRIARQITRGAMVCVTVLGCSHSPPRGSRLDSPAAVGWSSRVSVSNGQQHSSSYPQVERIAAVCATEDGVVLAGSTPYRPRDRARAWVAKMAESGDLVWSRRLESWALSRATGVARVGSRSVIVVGDAIRSAQSQEGIFLARIAETGLLEWDATIEGAAPTRGAYFALDDHGGRVVVAATQVRNSREAIRLWILNSGDGSQLLPAVEVCAGRVRGIALGDQGESVVLLNSAGTLLWASLKTGQVKIRMEAEHVGSGRVAVYSRLVRQGEMLLVSGSIGPSLSGDNRDWRMFMARVGSTRGERQVVDLGPGLLTDAIALRPNAVGACGWAAGLSGQIESRIVLASVDGDPVREFALAPGFTPASIAVVGTDGLVVVGRREKD